LSQGGNRAEFSTRCAHEHFVVCAYARLRETLAGNRQHAVEIAELERRVDSQNESTQQIITARKVLMKPAGKPLKQIGFRPEAERKPEVLRAYTR
jgi:hypothetical protein